MTKAKRFRGHAMALLIAAWLSACAAPAPSTQPATENGQEAGLPTVGDLRSRLDVPIDTTLPAAPFAVARISVLTFPLAGDLAPAWAHVFSVSPLSPQSLAAWRDNGIDVGVVNFDQLQAFTSALPEALSVVAKTLATAPVREAILASPPLARPLEVAIPGQWAGVSHLPRAGRLQLLARIAPAEGNRVTLELTPQHHVVGVSIVPRTAEQVALAGKVIEGLTLRVQLEPTQLLVLALHRDPPPPPEVAPPEVAPSPHEVPPPPPGAMPDINPRDPAARPEFESPLFVQPPGRAEFEAPPTTQPVAEAPTTQPALGPININRLGANLLAAERFRRPIQTLLIIQVQPGGEFPAPAAQPAP